MLFFKNGKSLLKANEQTKTQKLSVPQPTLTSSDGVVAEMERIEAAELRGSQLLSTTVEESTALSASIKPTSLTTLLLFRSI